MTGKIPRKTRDKSTYSLYFKKAKQYYEVMGLCIKEEKYDSAALNGIHAVISSIDALLVFKGGVVSSSMRHEDAVKILKEIWIRKDTGEYSVHALKVLKMKSIFEHTDMNVNREQAETLAKHVTRFVEWAKRLIE